MENRKQKYYHMTVAGLERDLPICPLNDKLQIAGFVIFGDPELTTACAAELNARVPEYDYAISAEAKGIPLVHEMARLDGNRRYVLARKAPKLYMTGVFGVEVKSITTSQAQHLYLDVTDAELMRGKRILIVDDVVSTGASLAGLVSLVEKAGQQRPGLGSVPRLNGVRQLLQPFLHIHLHTSIYAKVLSFCLKKGRKELSNPLRKLGLVYNIIKKITSGFPKSKL